MDGTTTIRGIKMVSFSVEKATEGGIGKRALAEWLKEQGIEYSFHNAYTPYVGQFAIWIEQKHEDKVSEYLWG